MGKKSKLKLDKDTLHVLYWDKGLHASQIAEQYGCSKQTILRKMRSFGIDRRSASESKRGILNNMHGVKHSDLTKKKMSEAFKKGRIIHSGRWGRGSYYDTPHQGRVRMRSSWETKVADYLTENGYDWYYEYKWLDLGNNQHYLPDFYIPNIDCHIEVKGFEAKPGVDKFKIAEKKYNVKFWNGEELLRRGIISNSGDTELNRKYRGKEPADAII